MTWLWKRWHGISDCRCYEINARYFDGSFQWRGRHIQSDRLIAASADRSFVEQRCENDALSAMAEATA